LALTAGFSKGSPVLQQHFGSYGRMENM